MKKIAVFFILFVISALSIKAFAEQSPPLQQSPKAPIVEGDELFFEEEGDLEDEEVPEGFEEG